MIPRLTAAEVADREARAEGRMKRKLLALRKMLEGGRVTLHLGDGRIQNPLRAALEGKGTVIE